MLLMTVSRKALASPVVPSAAWPLHGDSDVWEPSPWVPKLSFPSFPVRDPQGMIRLYTKGADTVILERLQRRGPNETFTEMALDVSLGRKGLVSLLLALGWVSWSPLLLFLPLPSGFWSFFLPSALGAPPAYGTGAKRASNPPSMFCMDQLHRKAAYGDAVGWGRESEPRGRPPDPAGSSGSAHGSIVAGWHDALAHRESHPG